VTSVLAQKGQIVIPKAIRDELHLSPGDDFEVYLHDGEIVLRPIANRRNQGLAALLMNPPGPLDLAERESGDLSEPMDFS
jgi:AbrB family looped-hinge helix DNA binding protein